MVGQRIFGIALGYEDVVDHDELRHDPIMAVLAGKLVARRKNCAPVAGKSTLNRLELGTDKPSAYHKIGHDPQAIEDLFVDLLLEAHQRAPRQIILDLDATDDPLHGNQEGRFFHGYYDCYCYLPLYVFCGRHLLAAKLRRSNIDASAGAGEEVARIVGQIRARWPAVRILLRADPGFAREGLMRWCELNGVNYLFGLARNARLTAAIAAELEVARQHSAETDRPARRFKDFMWSTLDSWSRERRVVVFGEFGATSICPTVKRTLSVSSSISRSSAAIMPTAAEKASRRLCRGVVPAWAAWPRTSMVNQRRPWMPVTAPMMFCVASRIGPCSIWAST